MPGDPTWLAFNAGARDLSVVIAPELDADALWNAIVVFMPGWPMREVAPRAQADIAINGPENDMTISAESWDGGASHAADVNNAANALAGLLIDGLLAYEIGTFCLHAAAVEIGGRAVLIAGPSGAGKSTLALRLAARGCRHLADDRILLLPDAPPYRVAALGLAAKARKPLPPGDDLARLHADHWFIDAPDIAYLLLDEDATGEVAANFGFALPLGAIVVPCRDAGRDAPELRRAEPGDLARVLIEEATSPHGATAIVPAMSKLAEAVDGYILDYGDGQAAADALLTTFENR